MADRRAVAPRPSVFDRVRLGTGGLGRLHALALWLMVSGAAVCGFAGRGDMMWTLAALVAAAAAGGLLVGRLARVTLLDWLLALTPRDNLFLGIVGALVMAGPVTAGYWGWDYAMAALLIYLCPMAIHKWGTGRLMAASGLMAMGAACVAPLPPAWAMVAWLGATLLAMRCEAVALRLETYAPSSSVPVVTLARETAVAVVLPLGAGVGLLAWMLPLLLPHTRYLLFESRLAGERIAQLNPPSMDELLWDTAILLGLIVALIAAIIWFEKQIGGRRRGQGAEAATHLDANESRAFVPPDDEPLPLDTADDTRGRILARFRRWLAVGEKVGHPRGGHETPAEVLARFGRELDAALDADPAARELIERAAYSHLPMDDRDEATFERWAREAEPTLREAAARRAAARAVAGQLSGR